MKLLAIETSSDLCSVALHIDGMVTERVEDAAQQHARVLLPMIDDLLGDSGLKPIDLDGLVFGQGPGSFTGVRIAAATVQGIALACGIPVVGISTLEAIAYRSWREHDLHHCISLIDARMQQVYMGTYQLDAAGFAQLIDVESVLDPAQVSAPRQSPEDDRWHLAGSGAAAYASEFEAMGFVMLPEAGALQPLASDLLSLAIKRFERGETVDAAQALPVYLRDKVALTERERML